MSKPLVAIVGRPNVGKSMLFNKLTGRRTSIVEDTPGVTRDRIYGDCEWCGRKFSLVDTGGIEPGTENDMLKFMRRQAEIGILLADCIIMVVDVRSGVTAADMDVATMLRKSGKPVALAVNKCDSVGPTNPDVYEFYALGIGDLFETSAVHGHGTGDLLDWCLAQFPEETEEEEETDVVSVAIVGKPNVGKSSLLNRLAGFDRAIVTDIPGTTRDMVEESVRVGSLRLRLMDTAGIRETVDTVEALGVERSKETAQRADLVLFVCDGSQPLTEEDREAMDLALDAPNAIAFLNKADLGQVVEPADLPFDWVLPICARDGSGLERLPEILETLFAGSAPCDGSILTNPRQYDAIRRAYEAMLSCMQGMKLGQTPDALLTDLEEAMSAMGEVTGATVREDITARIFERFCVGK